MAKYEVLTSEDGSTWELNNKFTDGEQAKNYTFSMIERGTSYTKMVEIEGSKETTILYGEPKPPESENDGGNWMRQANREGSKGPHNNSKNKLSQENTVSISNVVMLVGIGIILVLASITIGKYIFHINDIDILFFISAGILSFAAIFYYVIAVIPAKISAMTFTSKKVVEEDTIESDNILGAELRTDQMEIGAETDLVPEEAFEIKKRIRQFVKNIQAVAKASNSRINAEMTSRMSMYAFLSQVIRSLAFEEKLDFEKQVLTLQEIYSLLGYPPNEIAFFAKNILLFEALPLIRSMSNAGNIAFDMFNNDQKGECIRHIKQSLDDWSANSLQNPFSTEMVVIGFQADTPKPKLIRSICNSFIDFNIMKEVSWGINFSIYVIKTGTPFSTIFKDVIEFSNRTKLHEITPRVSLYSGPIIDTLDVGHTVADYAHQMCNESHNGLLIAPKFQAVNFPKQLFEQMREIPSGLNEIANQEVETVGISLQMLDQYVKSTIQQPDTPQSAPQQEQAQAQPKPQAPTQAPAQATP